MGNPIKFYDPLGLDTVTAEGAIRIPGFIGDFFGHEASPQGLTCGVAFSFPGPLGGKWDFGVYGGVQAGGKDIGIGKFSIGLGYQSGSVSDLGGGGAEMGAHFGRFGGSASFNGANNFTGGSIHYGYGYGANASGTVGGTASFADGVRK